MNTKGNAAWLLILALPYTAATNAAGIFEYEKNVASGKGTIVDYYLACDSCESGVEGTTTEERFTIRANLISKAIPESQVAALSGLRRKPTSNLFITRTTFDRKNGYLKLAGMYEELGFLHTAALFSRAGKTAVFAWSSLHQGANDDTHIYRFFEVSGTEWRDVTNVVLPDFSLKDFAVTNAGLFEYVDKMAWEIVLPRYGTIAYLVHQPPYEVAEVEARHRAYQAYTGENYAMELRWDKEMGRFTKGKIVSKDEFEVKMPHHDADIYGELEDCNRIAEIQGGTREEVAQVINDRGYAFYRHQQYQKAAEYFRCAIVNDSSYANAHYNYASTLALMYGEESDGADAEVIVQHLRKTVELLPGKLTKLLADPDLYPVSCTPQYKKFVEEHVKRESFTVVAHPVAINRFDGGLDVVFQDEESKRWFVPSHLVNGFESLHADNDSSIDSQARFRLMITSRLGEQGLSGYCLFNEKAVVSAERIEE